MTINELIEALEHECVMAPSCKDCKFTIKDRDEPFSDSLCFHEKMMTILREFENE